MAALDPDTSYRKATALREYNERVAGGEPPREVADDVVDRYRMSDPGPTALPKPRFLDGDRSDPKALEEARLAAAAAYKEGRISEEQADDEAQLIRQLMEYAENLARQPRGERK